MAAPSGGQDQGGEKNTYYILWLIALVCFVSAIIWYFADVQLKMFFIGLRKYELIAIYVVVGFLPYDFIRTYIPQFPDLSSRVASDLSLVRDITPDNLTMDIVEALSTEVGIFLIYPAIITMAVLAIYVYRNHILMLYKRRHSTQSLVLQEVKNWPQIKIVSKVDLLAQDLDSGPWGMAMTPMQYAKKNKLIQVELAEIKGSGFSKTQAPEFDVTLDRARAERALGAQLGRPWQGVAAMAPHRRAVFAIFIGRACRDSKRATELVYQLADSAGDGKFNFKGADELWQKHIKTKSVERICQGHAYEFTILASMLLFAREDGVLASADFLWLKPMDRRLWYVINNVGKQTPGAEVGGIFCHWYNELALKRPLSVPRVNAAVDALETALSNIIYVPDEKEREEIMKRHQERN
jgi:intracellular multiplication protein IcmP